MAIDYEKILNENIREYGEGTKHLSFLEKLYSDETHFIYELLQNAEDAGANKVIFELFKDRLEVSHNGRRFTEADVRGVCGVGKGTKEEDSNKIGKFGIGFKSVYAYTNSPIIHSGEESFQIDKYIRPHKVDPVNKPLGTKFIFFFDKKNKTPEKALEEIGTRLLNLTPRTLLFLTNIKEIEYKLEDKANGFYIREETQRGAFKQTKVLGSIKEKEEEENWLIFQKAISIDEKYDEFKIEVGFKIEPPNVKDKLSERIVRVIDSPLVVFFPTEKPTGFGFLIQGPFETTPARDNITNSEINKFLIKEIALFMKEILLHIKEIGLISISLYEALPIRIDDFQEGNLFLPIAKSIQETMKYEKLILADNHSFICGEEARLASAEWLRNLFNKDQLMKIYQKELMWIHGDITERAKSEIWRYFKDRLKIEEISPDSISRKLDKDFFESQSDQWMIDFILQLPGQKTLWNSSIAPLRRKPFLRLENGCHVEPFDSNGRPKVYIGKLVQLDNKYPLLKSYIVSNENVRHFLIHDLRIPEFDMIAEVIESVIPKYTTGKYPIKEEHLQDLKKIRETFNTDSFEARKKLITYLSNTPFILSAKEGSDAYYKPSTLYFYDELLEKYFTNLQFFINPIYGPEELEIFKLVGVSSTIRVQCKSMNGTIDIDLEKQGSMGRKGINGFDPDIKVEGLTVALNSHPSIEVSLLIWNKICIPYAHCIKGKIKKTKGNFSPTYEELESINFGKVLREKAWLPNQNNEFKVPSELSLDELPNDFEKNEKVAELLGMKKDVVSKLAEEVGVSKKDLELIQKYPEEFKKFIELRKSKTEFPESLVTNPERRELGVLSQFKDAPLKEYERQSVSQRVSYKNDSETIAYLREKYTNTNGIMFCQICKEEMPFRKPDNQHYFEKKEILSNKHLPKEYISQYLALCPTCAAKYNVFISYNEDFLEKIKVQILQKDERYSKNFCEVSLVLGKENTSIRFVEKHFLDLKTILQQIKRETI